MVSQKKVLSVKIDPGMYEAVKTQAELGHVPMADIITQSLEAHARNEHLNAKNKELQRRLEDVEKRLETITGRKSGKSKRLTVTVPAELYAAIHDAAHSARMSKSELVMSMFGKSGKLPALEAV